MTTLTANAQDRNDEKDSNYIIIFLALTQMGLHSDTAKSNSNWLRALSCQHQLENPCEKNQYYHTVVQQTV